MEMSIAGGLPRRVQSASVIARYVIAIDSLPSPRGAGWCARKS